MPLDCALPDEARRELILLGIWYRARHGPGYRRKVEKNIGAGIDQETGLEFSEADLLPAGQALRGPQFVMEGPVQPDRLAEETLLREEYDGSRPSLGQCQAYGVDTTQPDPEQPGTFKTVTVMRCPLNEKGRAEEEALHIAKENPDWKPRVRTLQGREAWTELESEAMAEMTFLWQKTLLDFARKGWILLEPPVKFESVGIGADPGNNPTYAKGVDSKGLPTICSVTPAGLDEAERRIAGDPLYSQGAYSSIEAMPGDLKAKVAMKNPWAWQRHIRAGGK
jgi:hypothetical protein